MKINNLDIAVISSLPGIAVAICIFCRMAWRDRKRRKQWAREDAERGLL